MSRSSVRFRWLGVAGSEWTAGDDVLAVDPFFTRLSLWRMFFGRAVPDAALTAQTLPRCSAVLISHAHYDHLMDLPAIVRQCRPQVLAPANACRLLAALGVDERRTREIGAGERFALGVFTVDVLAAEHTRILGRVPFAGALPARLQAPQRARDYRMDACFSFLLECGGLRVLDWRSERPGPAPAADVLLVMPGKPDAHYAELLRAARPRLVIPQHWDDFFSPLSRPLRPGWSPPALRWPPLARFDLKAFARTVERLAPGTRVLLPEIFAPYQLG